MSIETEVRAVLSSRLCIAYWHWQDQSAYHVGHAGNRGSGGHYRVTIVSDDFTGLNKIERHRLIYAQLSHLWNSHIHALSLVLLTPVQWKNYQQSNSIN